MLVLRIQDNEDGHLTNNSMRSTSIWVSDLSAHSKSAVTSSTKWYDMIWMEKFIGEHKVNPDAVTKPEI